MPIQDRYCYRLPQLANVTHYLTPSMYHDDFRLSLDNAVGLYLKGNFHFNTPKKPLNYSKSRFLGYKEIQQLNSPKLFHQLCIDRSSTETMKFCDILEVRFSKNILEILA